MKRVALLVAAGLVLSGCGLRPLYGGGPDGAVRSTLSAVEVAPIQGQSGWLVANALKDRLDHNDAPARYRLEVKLDDQISGLGVRRDDSVSRERRTLRARYQLVDLATDTIVVDASAESDAGIDVVSSEYATIAAEQTALENLALEVADRIVTRLTLTLREGGRAAS